MNLPDYDDVLAAAERIRAHAHRTPALPVGGGSVEQTSLPMDDGVPASGTDVVKAGAGNCHHGL